MFILTPIVTRDTHTSTVASDHLLCLIFCSWTHDQAYTNYVKPHLTHLDKITAPYGIFLPVVTTLITCVIPNPHHEDDVMMT